MFEKRCSLCGGKIVHGRCVDCGLDATKNDKHYRVNQSSCDHEPLTHVHTEKEMNAKYHSRPIEKRPIEKRTIQNKNFEKWKQDKEAHQKETIHNKKKSAKLGVIIAIVISVLGILGDNVGTIFKSVEDIFNETDISGTSIMNESFEESGEYDDVTRELSTEGQSYDETLKAGFYKVGTHIPEGTYTVKTVTGYGSMSVADQENNINIYQSMDNQGESDYSEQEVTDVRLYQGAWVTISYDVVLQFTSENAQIDSMETAMDNPLTEYKAFDGTEDEEAAIVIGEDCPAGFYDITATEGYSSVQLFVPDHTYTDTETEEEYSTIDLSMDASGESKTYKNVSLPEGTTLEYTGLSIELAPSSGIVTTDYESVWGELNY